MPYSNVIDMPLQEENDDLLGMGRYAEALAEFISVARMPTTLAIQGEWGSGKTSLMNQLRHRLCVQLGEADAGEKAYYGIWINTWQYSLMRDPEDTLLSVMRGVTDEVLNIMRRRHQTKLAGTIEKVGSVFAKLATIGAKAAANVSGIGAERVDELLSGNGKNGPAAFREAISSAIEQCLEEDRAAGHAIRGFLFFIDDLDRIDPPVAVQILELLKNLFEVENCLFILAIDYDVVVKGLTPKFGPLTEKNEREFRSFFDKIIQLPFSMPINSYSVDSYLANSLQEIGYFTSDQFSNTHEKQKISLQESLAEMVMLSTGANPRSVKRLINSLSLIKIMHSITSGGEMSEREKLINFGFVCVQIAYPGIYSMLLAYPDYKKWDEKVARRFHASALEAHTKDILIEQEDFDEEWEQVVYRVCQHNAYLSARAYAVSRLLNLLAGLIGETDDFGAEVEHMLGFATVTTVAAGDGASSRQTQRERIRLQSLEEFIACQRERGVREELLPAIRAFGEHFSQKYGDTVRLEFARGGLSVLVANSKSRERRLAILWPQKNGFAVQTGEYSVSRLRSLDPTTEGGLPADFFSRAHERFITISSDAV